MKDYALVAVKRAPDEKFPNKSNIINGEWLADLFEIFIDPFDWGAPLISKGGVKEVYKELCKCLKTEEGRAELLNEIQNYDHSVTIDDLYSLRDFLKVCVDNEYDLYEIE